MNPDTPKLNLLALVGVAMLTALFFTVLAWSQNTDGAFGALGSTDDMTRMVVIRDWMNGQSWFDPMLYRLGVEPGTTMHWSRLIDLPIAGLILLFNAISPSNGEWLAVIAWPFLTFVAALTGLFVAVRRASRSSNLLPALIIGGFALSMSAVFDSGVIDHHNLQLALLMWLIAMLLPEQNTKRDFALAAVISSVMMAIGMEALPLIIAAAGLLYVRLITEGDATTDAAARFGLTLALSTAGLFVALVGPSRYSAVYCDAFSAFHLVSAGAGGLALYFGLLPNVRAKIPHYKIIVPLLAGALALILTALFFPECLSNPLAKLDPLLRTFWLDRVMETQSFLQIAKLDPWLLPYLIILPVLAILSSLYFVIKDRTNSTAIGMLLFASVTLGITAFQMRGTQFATPAAALALSIYVTRFAEGPGKTRPVLLLAAILFSCMFFWKIAIVGAISLFGSGETGPLIAGGAVRDAEQCKSDTSIASLNAEPVGTIAAANNFGPTILYSTKHLALAGPYHRDIDGNLAWINAMMGDAQKAKSILQNVGTTLLAICPADPDVTDFTDAAPQSFIVQLLKGQTFDWLEPVESTMETPLMLWRVAK